MTTAQLLAAGFGANAIAARVEGGWLVRRHQGVYQLGVFGGPLGREAAALLACGAALGVSHFTSGERAGSWARAIAPRARPRRPSADGFAGASDGHPPPPRVALLDGDVVERDGLRMTTPARTLLDLAGRRRPPARSARRGGRGAGARDPRRPAGHGRARRRTARREARCERSWAAATSPRSPARRRRGGCESSCGPPSCRCRGRTRGVAGLEVDARVAATASRRRGRRVSAITARGRPSSATAAGTRSCSSPATACSGSPGGGSRASLERGDRAARRRAARSLTPVRGGETGTARPVRASRVRRVPLGQERALRRSGARRRRRARRRSSRSAARPRGGARSRLSEEASSRSSLASSSSDLEARVGVADQAAELEVDRVLAAVEDDVDQRARPLELAPALDVVVGERARVRAGAEREQQVELARRPRRRRTSPG